MDRKVIFITGASSGVGMACAESLLKDGHIVFGTSRNATFPSHGYRIEEINILPLDLQDLNSIKMAVDYVIGSCGRIDILINNAGYGFASPIEDAPIDEVIKLMNTNFIGAVFVIQQILPFMRKQSSGLIINTSSLAGRFSVPFNGFYASTKFAIEAVSEALYMELRGTKIRVVVIEPGDMSTNFTDSRKKYVNKDGFFSKAFSKALEIVERDERNGSSPYGVADAVKKIVRLDRLKFRYAIGKEAWYVNVLHKILPDQIFLYFLGKHYGL